MPTIDYKQVGIRKKKDYFLFFLKITIKLTINLGINQIGRTQGATVMVVSFSFQVELINFQSCTRGTADLVSG